MSHETKQLHHPSDFQFLVTESSRFSGIEIAIQVESHGWVAPSWPLTFWAPATQDSTQYKDGLHCRWYSLYILPSIFLNFGTLVWFISEMACISWIYPPPSNSGKWWFIGIPYWKCNNPGGDCYWEGGRPNVYPPLANLKDNWYHSSPILRQVRWIFPYNDLKNVGGTWEW